MAVKSGYLTDPLKLFYVADQRAWECPFHYHDFDKVVIFLQGQVTYDIEGNSYALQPYDVVAVPAGQMHRPVVGSRQLYERIIAYISPEYVEAYRKRQCDMSIIFRAPSPILRQPREADSLYDVIGRLRHVCRADVPEDNTVLKETLFLEFLIYLSRAVRNKRVGCVKTGRQNEKIQAVLSYIQLHLTGDLSIPAIAEQFCISTDYLMHLFKGETGYSLGYYITIKRLLLARRLMQEGRPLTEVCYDSGFKQYSTFYRAWKKYYGTSPKQRAVMPQPAIPEQFPE